jgi:hypothetical protein
MTERYTDQELIDRGLLELSPDGHLRTPLPVYKKITIDVSKWDCPTQLDRIESKLDEVLVLLKRRNVLLDVGLYQIMPLSHSGLTIHVKPVSQQHSGRGMD